MIPPKTPTPQPDKHIAILGGSFNPPHIGHMRMLVEVQEQLKPTKTLLLPCASPPHKPNKNLLSFELREKLLDFITKTLPNTEICSIEKTLPVPSYSVDTLTALQTIYPENRFVFILGCGDFATLSSWNRWQSLPELTDFAVLPRGIFNKNEFIETIKKLWPRATQTDEIYGDTGQSMCFALGNGSKAIFIPQPRLDINSTIIRERFLKNLNIDFLIPEQVKSILVKNSKLVCNIWNTKM